MSAISPGFNSAGEGRATCIRSNTIDSLLGFPSRITAELVQEFEPVGGVMPKSLVPAQRIGAEEEMAGTILYLASKAGGYCNGSVVLVDGGVLSIHPSTY